MKAPFCIWGSHFMSLGDRHCSTITKLMRPGHGLSLMTWVVGYEHVTQRAHIVCSRVSAEALGTSCKDTMSLEPSCGFTIFTSCSFLHLPGDENLMGQLQNCWMGCYGVQAAVAGKLGCQSEVFIAAIQHLPGPGKVLHSSI